MTYAHGIAIPTPVQKPGQSHYVPVSGVQGAIARASQRTGVDFSYLLNKAEVESSLNPQAKAKNSSATGLYQFIEKTWLQMVRDHGEKYGLGRYANKIDANCKVSDSHLRKIILDLRKDPETSACMAAEYAAQNAETLQSQVGDITKIGQTELYMAHFMGASGATKFIENMHANPNRIGAHVFPQEARTNPGVFYDSQTGRPRTLKQIYNFFDQKFDNTATATREEDNMVQPVRNRPNLLKPAQQTTRNYSLSPSTEQYIGQTTDNVAFLEPDMVDRLLAHPPQPFATNDDQNPREQSKPIAEQLAELRQHNHQARVLVLAQLMAHEDSDRYNS